MTESIKAKGGSDKVEDWGSFLLVEVPEGMYNEKIVRGFDGIPRIVFNAYPKQWAQDIELPQGNYSMVGIAKDLIGKSDYGELLIHLEENDWGLHTTLILNKKPTITSTSKQ